MLVSHRGLPFQMLNARPQYIKKEAKIIAQVRPPVAPKDSRPAIVSPRVLCGGRVSDGIATCPKACIFLRQVKARLWSLS